ncbi:MAG TPA: cytochrome c3 family protein [Polyangiaceae bacterium]|nr:cytochrome c3 family protein [Polyangiaceae bacterium]
MQLFHRSLNKLPLALLVGVGSLTAAGTAASWYYLSPRNLQVGYAPKQPIPYSHKLHVGELGLDCRYCHANVERSQEAMIPPTQTCMGCHAVVKADSPKLAALRDSWKSGDPLPWIRVNKLPDHAYFDHSAHLVAGVGCVSCHGRVDQMQVVRLEAPLAMGWCLQCHREPGSSLRPRSEVTNMTWKSDPAGTLLASARTATGGPRAPEHCSGCHR